MKGHRRKRFRRGVILFVVTIVTAMVLLSAYGFLVMMQTEGRAAQLQYDAAQVDSLAQSGVEYTRTWARASREMRASWGGYRHNGPMFRGVVVDSDTSGLRDGIVSFVAPIESSEFATHLFQPGLVNESSKLSLHALLQWDREQPGAARAALMRLPGMTEVIADSVLDWIDADDEPREFGAEAEFYLALDPPRSPPNQIPAHLEDLLAVRGMTSWYWHDTTPTRPVLIDDTQGSTRSASVATATNRSVAMPRDATIEGPSPQWSRYLTVVSAERNESASGAARIHLNQNDLASLHKQLTAAFDERLANSVIAARQFGVEPASSNESSSGDMPAPNLQVASRFTLDTPLDLIDAQVQIGNANGGDAGSTKTFLSPLGTANAGDEQRILEFCDQTTTDDEERIVGRINIWECRREVLLALPGVTSEQVDHLLQRRDAEPEDAATPIHPVWMLLEKIMDKNTMQRIWPFVTVGGDVLGAQVIALYDEESPWMRCEVLVDGTRDDGPLLEYRDLRRMGRGFSLASLRPPETSSSGMRGTTGFMPPWLNRRQRPTLTRP